MKKYYAALLLAVLILLSACAKTAVLELDEGAGVTTSPEVGESDSIPDPAPETNKGEASEGSENLDGSESLSGSENLDGSDNLDGSENHNGSENLDGSENHNGSENLDGSDNLDGSEPPSPPAFLPFSIAFTGDISIAENYVIYENAVKKGYTVEDLFSPSILAKMRAADLLVINYESAVSDRGAPLSGKAYTFRTSTKLAKEILKTGADLIGLANNHVYDYGKDAFLDTLDTFAEMGLPTVGAGRNAEEAYTPFYYEQSGMTIAVIAASRAEKNYMTPVAEPDAPGIAGCYDSALVCQAVKKAKETADYVIVYAHFGYEYSTTIEAVQRKAAYDFIDAGADLIVGAHAHILQGVDVYKGKPIFYNLGNFLFNLKELDTALLEIVFESEGAVPTFRFLPCAQSGGRVIDESGTDEGKRILADLQKLSPNVRIDADGGVHFS